MEWNLPDLGDGISTATLLRVLVNVGDTITKNQAVLEVETDKVNLEVPAPVDGTVSAIHVEAGAKLNIGDLVFTIDSGAEETPAPQPETPAPPPAAAAPQQPASAPAQATLVTPAADGLRAAPIVRKLARELGIELKAVTASGPEGLILHDDLVEHVRGLLGSQAKTPAVTQTELPNFEKFGAVRREAMSQIRKVTAERMTQSWLSVPRVTHFDQADVTDLEQLRKDWKGKAEAAGAKLTVTAFLIKVVAKALRDFPQLNASIDMANESIVYKDYVHIGVAVDTPQGLVVPVIRDADKKGILELAKEVGELGAKARDKKLTLEDVQGACFTISNLGGVGGTNFTPIVNTPEVGILAVSRGRMQATWINNEWHPRMTTPLGVSYDHRLVDGAEAARFMRSIVDAVESPLWMVFG